MRKVRQADIMPIAEYTKERDRIRREIIAYKKVRRVPVGDLVSVLFENHRTLWFQTQEMLRTEHISDPRLVAEELQVYNDMIPDGLALAATLFIEIPDSSKIPDVLDQMIGVEEHVSLSIAGQRFPALAEPGRSTEDKTSSVHYLTIPLGVDGRQALLDGFVQVSLVIDHARYLVETRLGAETVASLLADLSEPE